MVKQLGQTPLKISMLSLLLCSEAHAKALIAFLKTANVLQETFANQFKDCVASLTVDNGLGFSDADLTPKGSKIQTSTRQAEHWRSLRELQGSSQELQASLKVPTLPYSNSTEQGIFQVSISLFRHFKLRFVKQKCSL